MDDDFGVVKEEVVEEYSPLPCINGRVVSWLVSADSGSTVLSETGEGERGAGVGETRPPSFHGGIILPPGAGDDGEDGLQ